MAAKKKTAAKKSAAKKSPARKKTAAKKSVAKKSPARKKTAAKKSVAKKSPARKKTAAKKSVKKAVAKKSTAKKSVAKKSTARKKSTTKKSTTKKSTTKKRTAKKTVKKSSATTFVIPPVPLSGGNRVNVSSTPTTVKSAAKPSAAPRQGSSGKTLLAVLVGVLILGAIVITRSGSSSDDAAPTAEPAVTESAMPEATTEPAAEPAATEAAVEPAATTGEAPTRFIGNWKDSSKAVMVITWKAPAGDVKGYKVETRSGMGAWNMVSEVSATTYSSEFGKKSEDGSTSFRVSAVYADGSLGVAKAFGFAGQFE